jgi:CheY-like chemotaxis protein
MKKVLVVDDDNAMRGLYRRRLSDLYELFETGDPEQAIALALEHRPDAILLDLRMPKFDGFELCQNFRSLGCTSQLPIFVITGQSGAHKKECDAMGAAGYFEKPIDFAKLKEALAAALETDSSKRTSSEEFRLRVPLVLKGRNGSGKVACSVETESVSADGFLCSSGGNLDEGEQFDVFLAGKSSRHAGVARVVEKVSAGLERHRYRFQFDSKNPDWIVSSSSIR